MNPLAFWYPKIYQFHHYFFLLEKFKKGIGVGEGASLLSQPCGFSIFTSTEYLWRNPRLCSHSGTWTLKKKTHRIASFVGKLIGSGDLWEERRKETRSWSEADLVQKVSSRFWTAGGLGYPHLSCPPLLHLPPPSLYWVSDLPQGWSWRAWHGWKSFCPGLYGGHFWLLELSSECRQFPWSVL